MEYRLFGRTGVRVSRLVLGCMNFGGRTDEAEAARIIGTALDAGIIMLDTANVFGHEPGDFTFGRGRSEEIVGRALRGRRDEVFLASKVHYPMGEGPNASGNSRRHIIEQCEASLRRLGTDRIDLYQLHGFDVDVPIDESLHALDDLSRRGLIRYAGASGFPAWRHVEAMWAAKEWRLRRLVSEQPPYNLLDRRIERELIRMAQTYDLAVIVWSPLAGGYLTGGYRMGVEPPVESRFGTFWREWGREHDKPEVHQVVAGLGALAAGKGCHLATLALAWVIHQPGVTAPIIGPRTVAHLASALKAFDVEFTDEDRRRIDALVPPGHAVVPYYAGGAELWQSWKASALAWR